MSLGWSEKDSGLFLEYGRLFTPQRDAIASAVLSLIPARKDEAFEAVELGCGDGWLSALVLDAFPRARVVALDGSEVMLGRARQRLAAHGPRAVIGPMRFEDDEWLHAVPSSTRCVFTAMALHHVDGARKRQIFAALNRVLEPGGALIVADVVEPASELERRYVADAWDAAVKQQSRESTGSEIAFDRFAAERWNCYRYRDPGDKPSRLADQLRWLEETGFEGACVLWMRAGHAVLAGFKRKP